MSEFPPRSIDALFAALARSRFRSRFHLSSADLAYLRDRGFEAAMRHAERFIDERLAPASPANDGRQTPWRGHPVFVAQHATGICCRGCISKWHAIDKGRPLTPAEKRYLLSVLQRWLEAEMARRPGPEEPRPAGGDQPALFD